MKVTFHINFINVGGLIFAVHQIGIALNQIKKSKPAVCITMGWLISDFKKKFVFIGDINFNDDGTINEGGNSTVIPKSNILKLKEIKL